MLDRAGQKFVPARFFIFTVRNGAALSRSVKSDRGPTRCDTIPSNHCTEAQKDNKTQELITVGASVACGCIPCLEYHVEIARQEGASPAELATAFKMAQKVRQAPMDKMHKRRKELEL